VEDLVKAPIVRRIDHGARIHAKRVSTRYSGVPWLASRLLGLQCEFEVHAPPELIGYLKEGAAPTSRAEGSGAFRAA
jgi:predicted DNA-binding transcriptional regulator YafY